MKVLDFGLAMAVAQPEGDLSGSPTINPTRMGTVVGTAAYMRPEQARGLAVDKRTDIWAFGCVLLSVGTPTPLFMTRAGGALLGPGKQQYVVSRDGQRFLMNTVTTEFSSPLRLVLNWKAAAAR